VNLDWLAGLALVLAGVPALLFLVNLRVYRGGRMASSSSSESLPPVSILIPARNEERCIVAACSAALATRGVVVEVVVLDDHSEDRTADLVAGLAQRDARVRLLRAPELPPGWCGKQHACWVLAAAAVHPLLLFLDADVRLAPDGLAVLVRHFQAGQASLLSGVPRQETGTLLEKLLIPLIHFLLLGYLPMPWMRRSRSVIFAAGCGQLFLASREAYQRVGGHSVIRTTLHDGLELPRAFRAGGEATDLIDATNLACCRMYRSGGEVWRGLAKNATEGLGAPARIVPFTFLLLGGQVLPFVLLSIWPWLSFRAAWMAGLAALLSWLPRFIAAAVFRQSWLGAWLHPVGILLLIILQWYALARALLGRSVTWKGREVRTLRADQVGRRTLL
jgi:glycosyltransferase involved in cell wall biosynthesis